MNRDKKPLGYYNYTVILTYVGMIAGFFGIVFSFDAKFYTSIICLMFAGFCDMFDGTVAATKERTEAERNFGIQIDSLSDLICFGVLPATIVYNINQGNVLVLIIATLYVLCALIRLAYFNVDEQERQQTSESTRELYSGLPVTMSALFLPLVFAIINFLSLPKRLLAIAILIMAILFLTPFQLRKPKKLGKMILLLCGFIGFILVLFSVGIL